MRPDRFVSKEVDPLLDGLRSQWGILRAAGITGPVDAAALIATGADPTSAYQIAHSARMAEAEEKVYRQWEETRVVWRVNDSLRDALAGSVNDVVSPPVRLPHPNPLIVFETPLLLQGGELRTQLDVHIKGMFVAGASKGRKIQSTTERTLRYLVILFGDVVEDGVVDRFARHHVVTVDGVTTMDEQVERIVASFKDDPIVAASASPTDESLAQVTEAVLGTVIPLLVYMGSAEPDMRTWPDPPPSRSKKVRSRKPALVADVGWTIGPLLRDPLPRSAPGEDDDGVSPRPHLRRGHWHRYRCGPRDDWHYELRWLHPALVNTDRSSEATGIVLR